MLGKNSHLNPLASRKRLLLAESELNRAQMIREWQIMADKARTLAHQAKTIGSLVSATTLLVVGLRSLRCKKSPPPAGKSSWLQTIVNGAGLVSTFWRAFRPPTRN